MTVHAMLEIHVESEAVLRRGEIPTLRYLSVVATDEGIVGQLKELALRLTYQDRGKQKDIVTIKNDESDSFYCRIVDGFAMWVLWVLLKEACAAGWEPYAGSDRTTHLLRKEMTD